jgi:hypothetical protein
MTSPCPRFCPLHCRCSISARSNNRSPARHHKLRHKDLDDLTMLIARLAAHADHSAINARAGGRNLFDLA